MLTFTPLLGAQSDSAASASLLELEGGIKVLVDVGWDSAFNTEQLHLLEQHASTLSVILLTHATIEHLGAYAYACKHIAGFQRIPVYATTPIVNLGRGLLQDIYAGSFKAAGVLNAKKLGAAEEDDSILLSPPTEEEIGSYFGSVNQLKYSQPHQPIPSPFSPSLSGLTITAYSAGHSLGGTIWHIQHGLESIVYAADWNMGRENLFPGAAWLSSSNEINEPLFRPTALICSSRGLDRSSALPRKERDESVVRLIRETIAQGGKVLLPMDTSARVLEMAFLLNKVWDENSNGPHADTFKHARIYMASRSSKANVRYLQSMLEWMDDAVIRDAEAAMTKGKGQGKVTNPLDWTYIRQIDRKSQVQRLLSRSRPCVLLASDSSLDWGFSRSALEVLGADVRNLVILTEPPNSGAASKQLWDVLQSQQASSGAKVINADELSFELQDTATSALSSEGESRYSQYLARQHQLHSSLQGDNTINDATTVDIADDQASESSDSEDEDEDPEHQGRALNISAQMTQGKRKAGALSDVELGVNILLRAKNAVHDFDVRNKRGREKVFPFVMHRTREDDFGELIKAEDYLRAEERDAIDGVDMKAHDSEVTTKSAIGEKRKWVEDAQSARGKKGDKRLRQNQSSPSEKSTIKKGPDETDLLIARITGEAKGNAVAAANVTNGTEVEDESTSASEESDYEPEDLDEEARQAKKITTTSRTLVLRCKLTHVDLSALPQLRDLQGLLPRIRPRKLIITAGGAAEAEAVANMCKELSATEGGSMAQETYTPATGETIDASVDTHAWMLKLSRALTRRLVWKELERGGGLSVASISGLLEPPPSVSDEPAGEDDGKKKKPKLDKDLSNRDLDPASAIPILDNLPPHTVASNSISHKATRPVHVGDLRLHDIRAQLLNTGHSAEFRGQGALLVDGTVVVRKSLVTGGLELEAGSAGLAMPGWRTSDRDGTFYAVRRAVYGGLADIEGST